MRQNPSAPDLADLRRGFAMALRAQDYVEASRLGQQLVALEPDQPVVWFNLGYSLRMLRRFETALEAYGQSIARGIERSEDAHINRAHILIEHLRRAGQGERELKAALAANPAALPALLSLGQLHEDFGRTDAAAEVYRRALAVAPDCGRALARLSTLRRMAGDGVPALKELETAVERLSPYSDDFAEVSMALGQAFEASGRYRDAFEAYSRANRAVFAAVPPGLRFDAVAERIIAAPVPPVGAELSGTRSGPVFICGMFRSGSTLVESILARHPRVTAGGELETLPALVAGLSGYPESVAALNEVEVAAMRESYWSEVDAVMPDADIVIDKRPDNFLHLGLISRLFPNSPIIHTQRNRDDVAISVFGNLFGPAVPYASSWSDIGHWQAIHERVMAHWRNVLGENIMDLRYEKLVGDVEGVMRRVVAHCALEWSDDLLHAENGPPGVRTLSQWQVRGAVNAASVGRAEAFRAFLPRD